MVIYQKGSCPEVLTSTAGMAIKFIELAPLGAVALLHYISGALLADLPIGADAIVAPVELILWN